MHLVILEVIGTPEYVDKSCCQSDKAYSYFSSLKERKGKGLNRLFPASSSLALDLLKRLLEFNPSARISAAEALKHPFFDSIRQYESSLGAVSLNSCSLFF